MGPCAWRTFWRITFPLSSRPTSSCLFVFGIGALKIFDQAFIVSGGTGGPGVLDLYAMLYIYNEGVQGVDFGVAAAAGVVLFTAHLPPHPDPTGDGRTVGGRRVTLQPSHRQRRAARPPTARALGVFRQSRRSISCFIGIALLFFTPFLWTTLDLVQDAAGYRLTST